MGWIHRPEVGFVAPWNGAELVRQLVQQPVRAAEEVAWIRAKRPIVGDVTELRGGKEIALNTTAIIQSNQIIFAGHTSSSALL